MSLSQVQAQLQDLNALGAELLVRFPEAHDYLAVLKGVRNGIVYGVKIRFPHAVVMSVLFGRGDWQSRVQHIFRATKSHASNLGLYVGLYKLLMLIQKKSNGKQRDYDSLVAGGIAGYVMFGRERSAVNEQIVLYVTARIVAGMLPRAHEPTPGAVARPISPTYPSYAALATVTWAVVMWLFQHYPERVQPGMFSSMTYLYKDSEFFSDLRTLFWHNK
ncbi:peroxisomal membrane protein 4 [Auriculariales sp. MPI-PUGE-AT-0066]|nr:peroxisomal membrane protein 4 [Auriculariales sp. MPI-PUGE-AT-0066]